MERMVKRAGSVCKKIIRQRGWVGTPAVTILSWRRCRAVPAKPARQRTPPARGA
jgi:hypothetical protein